MPAWRSYWTHSRTGHCNKIQSDSSTESSSCDSSESEICGGCVVSASCPSPPLRLALASHAVRSSSSAAGFISLALHHGIANTFCTSDRRASSTQPQRGQRDAAGRRVGGRDSRAGRIQRVSHHECAHTHTRAKGVSRIPTPLTACRPRRRERAREVERPQLRQVVQRLGQRRAALSAQPVEPAHRVDGEGGGRRRERGREASEQQRAGRAHADSRPLHRLPPSPAPPPTPTRARSAASAA